MQAAMLKNGLLVTADTYLESDHGVNLYCMDQACKVPVLFIARTERSSPHFKTSGKGDSIHHQACAFAKPLSFNETLQKVQQFQTADQDELLAKNILRLNLNSLDPDYETKTVEREKKEKGENEIKVKQDNETPKSIGSLKSVSKLISEYTPDILATIKINVKGHKIPLSKMLISSSLAHHQLWNGEISAELPYFVHGHIKDVVRRDNIIYVNLKAEEGNYFSLIVFKRHFPFFTYSDERLIGSHVLSYGYLKKDDFKENRRSTNIVIKSDKYIEFLK